MANTPRCELNDELDAAYIIGMVATGEQLFLCDDHAAHFGLTLALQRLDPAEIVNAAQALKATATNGESGEAPANRPARKRATKAAKPKPPGGSKPGLPETPPAADQ